MKKIRLDDRLVQDGLAITKTKAKAMILAGEVLVNERIIAKAGTFVDVGSLVALKNTGPVYVSRGGIKLAGVLEYFSINLSNWFCLDVGASTGGFTDCLLQHGASHVFALDVGHGQLDLKIQQNPRVTWKESFHVKNLLASMLPRLVDLAVVDVSFISLCKVLPFVIPCIKPSGLLLALIKPQFEASKKDIGKNGVLKDPMKHKQVVEKIKQFAQKELHLENVKTANAVIKGPKGNQEVFLYGIRPFLDLE